MEMFVYCVLKYNFKHLYLFVWKATQISWRFLISRKLDNFFVRVFDITSVIHRYISLNAECRQKLTSKQLFAMSESIIVYGFVIVLITWVDSLFFSVRGFHRLGCDCMFEFAKILQIIVKSVIKGHSFILHRLVQKILTIVHRFFKQIEQWGTGKRKTRWVYFCTKQSSLKFYKWEEWVTDFQSFWSIRNLNHRKLKIFLNIERFSEKIHKSSVATSQDTIILEIEKIVQRSGDNSFTIFYIFQHFSFVPPSPLPDSLAFREFVRKNQFSNTYTGRVKIRR